MSRKRKRPKLELLSTTPYDGRDRAQMESDALWFREHADQSEYKRPLRDGDKIIAGEDLDHIHIFQIVTGVRMRLAHDAACELVPTAMEL